MSTYPTNHYFIQLAPAVETYLQSIQHVTLCQFYEVSELLLGLDIDKIPNKSIVCLQIRGNYVLQVQQGTIISGFEAMMPNKFQIRRFEDKPDYIAVKFIMKKDRKKEKSVCFVAIQDQNINVFLQKLIEFPLIQEGFHERFDGIRKKGSGGFAHVFQVVNMWTGERVAVRAFKKKKLLKNDVLMRNFKDEVLIMKALKHKFICSLKEVYQTENSIYMIIQLLTRTLKSHFACWGFPHIDQAKIIMLRLAKAVQYLHSSGIIHRDIKLENIMVRHDRKEDVEPVLVDFGHARREGEVKQGLCGTPGYIPPQLFVGEQISSKKGDVFSLGVVFHFMLFGRNIIETYEIIQEKNARKVMQKNRRDFSFSNYAIPDSMRSLLVGMFNPNPNERLDIDEVCVHSFFEGIKA